MRRMDAIGEARRIYQDFLDASRNQRLQIEDDLRFSDPSDPQQWDEVLRKSRENDPGGKRPCLTMDQTGQYVANVAGQVEQRPPSMHALPVGSGADKRAAEQLDGLFRHVEYVSRAQQHYSRALTSAARAGVGYLIVRPEYTDRALGYQEPRISSEPDPLRVVFDPWSIEIDGSDATEAFLLTPYSHRDFERRWGKKAEKISFGDSEQRVIDDQRQSIITAERWCVDTAIAEVVVFTDLNGDEVSLDLADFEQAAQRGEVAQEVRRYTDKRRAVKWSRMSGAEVLAKETVYPADALGIVPVYGYVGWADGRMTYCGIPRRAREPQQAYNYHVSEIRAYQQLAPKAPWIAPMRAVGAYKDLWDKSGVESRAWLPYDDIDEERTPIAAPQRAQVSINLANHTQGAEQALRDIQASIGMYQASLGAPSNESSGVAIEQRKQQGEASTAHFPAHLAASIGAVGRICMDMLPRLIDSRRQMRVLGIDLAPSQIVIDPKQGKAVQETPQGLSINPNVGEYDVRVVVGASYSTQRQQAQEAYTEMMRASPQMMPAIAPLWAHTLDVPHADKLAQVLTAVAPPEVRAILQPDQSQSTEQLAAEVEQLKQALQEAIQHAQEATQEADQARAELEEAKSEREAREDEVAIKAFDAVTKRMQAVGPAMSPEQVAQIAQQTAQEAAQGIVASIPQGPTPEDEEMQVQALMQQLQEVLAQQAAGTSQEVARLGDGQAQIAQAMANLIELVQAERERVPERDPATGDIVRVIDRIKKEAM